MYCVAGLRPSSPWERLVPLDSQQLPPHSILLTQTGARPHLVPLAKTVRDFDDAITIHSFGAQCGLALG